MHEPIAPPGFEPGSPEPESDILDHYTTGLQHLLKECKFKSFHRAKKAQQIILSHESDAYVPLFSS